MMVSLRTVCIKVDCDVSMVDVRGEKSPSASQDGDVDSIVGRDFVHGARELVVEVCIESVELLGDVECYGGYFAGVGDYDGAVV